MRLSAEQEAAILAIADQNGGRLTPDQVVAQARHPDSPLHGLFQWDDEAAAEAHRIQQARGVIKAVRVTVETHERTVTTCHFIRDPTEAPKEQGYVSVLRLRRDGDAARDAVLAEFQRATAALRRARAMALVLGVEGDVDGLLNGLEAAQRRAATAEARAA